MDIRQRYLKWRAGGDGPPARVAIAWARTPEPPALPWETRGDELRADLHVGWFDVIVTVGVETDPDTSWIGMTSLAEYRRDLSRMGYSRANAELLARQYVARDQHRLRTFRSGDWPLYRISVRVYRHGVDLTGDSLGNVDLGEDSREFEKLASQTVQDHGMIEHSIEAARDVLALLCVSPFVPTVVDGGAE